MKINANPHKSIKIYGNPQKSEKTYENSRKSMKIYEIHEHVWDIFVSKKEDGLYFIF